LKTRVSVSVLSAYVFTTTSLLTNGDGATLESSSYVAITNAWSAYNHVPVYKRGGRRQLAVVDLRRRDFAHGVNWSLGGVLKTG
jgi:hypothetical protein